MTPVLQAENVSMVFGGLKALSQLSFTLHEGELVSLIGPNGAGKTTFFNVLTGVYQPTSGNIIFKGHSVVGLKPHAITNLGLTRTFQNIRLFKQLTVFDNVRLGAHERADYGFWAAGLKSKRERKKEQEIADLAHTLLQELGLSERSAEIAGNLCYGDQRRLEITRALATGARTLLLDEPAAGMNERETEELMHDLTELRRKFSLTLLLIEHDMRLVMGLSERILVLDHGVLIAQGAPSEVRENPEVLRAYLGPSTSAEASVKKKSTVVNSEPPILVLKNIEVNFGPIAALKNVDLEVRHQELVTLIGANGAGKTTLLRTISGMVSPQAGQIQFMGRQIDGLTPHALVKLGIAHSPEGRRIFSDLTVAENLELGSYLRSDRKAVEQDLEKILRQFPRLKERYQQRAGTLSGGEQQMLAIARALMAKPLLLLLDEPSLGLAPQLVAQIFAIIREIHHSGVSVLLVEQNANQALATASRAYVIETGKIVLYGEADDLLHNPAVRSAYLGA